jgi:SAM-dependent methyltransferase
MDEQAFDAVSVFDEDYLYFYSATLTDERSDADVDVIWGLLDLEPGMRVLDLACGHGRIANRLAARDCEVTGLDATPLFLDLARRDAEARGVAVEYVEGDMRAIPWTGRFDRVVNWFTAFGYFDDEDNRKVLAQIVRALKPGGRAGLELLNRDLIVREFQPARVSQRDGDMMIDRSQIEPLTGRISTQRTIVRGGEVRRFPFFVRMFTFTELRDWLLTAGFAAVDGFGEDGTPLTPTSRRLIVTAML